MEDEFLLKLVELEAQKNLKFKGLCRRFKAVERFSPYAKIKEMKELQKQVYEFEIDANLTKVLAHHHMLEKNRHDLECLKKHKDCVPSAVLESIQETILEETKAVKEAGEKFLVAFEVSNIYNS